MNKFLEKNDIVSDMPSFYKTFWILWDYGRKNTFDLVSNYFGDYFITHVIEGNRYEPIKRGGPFSLGMSTRKEELVLPPILLQDWDFITIL